MNEQIETRLNELRGIAKRYAVAKSEAEYLENFKKSKLAILMKKYEKLGAKTAAQQERDARSDAEYLELLEGLKVAIEESEATRWELEIARLGAGLWQTSQANKRQEMKSYEGS